jgi:hypothetical protein
MLSEVTVVQGHFRISIYEEKKIISKSNPQGP